jgi:hypothetical protein
MIGRIVFVFGIAASVSAILISAAQASWGCGATDGAVTGRSWGFRNQIAASHRALAECAQRSKRGHCRIVSCNPSVDTYDEAHATWFSEAHMSAPVERQRAKAVQTAVRASATAAATGKCTSVQARCAIEVGAHCDPKTGYWCVGGGRRGNNYCGGNHSAWFACLDRVRGTRR